MSSIPLTPPDCDLQDFAFMPLMVSRLRKSKAWVKARRNPALGFYMVNLWMAAWHEVPAGSLEDDDDVLADAAMCEASKWSKVREDVLRGWTKCDDGRLYHPVVCERVLEAWKAKTERQEKNAHENERKRLEREERAGHFAALKAAGIHKAWNTSLSDLREAVRNLSGGQVTDVEQTSRLREGQGERERQGQGQGEPSSVPTGTGGKPPAVKPKSEKSPEEMAKAELWRAAVSVLEQGGCPPSQCRTFMGKLVQDYTFEIVQKAVAAAVSEQPAEAREFLKATCQRLAGERKPTAKGMPTANHGAHDAVEPA